MLSHSLVRLSPRERKGRRSHCSCVTTSAWQLCTWRLYLRKRCRSCRTLALRLVSNIIENCPESERFYVSWQYRFIHILNFIRIDSSVSASRKCLWKPKCVWFSICIQTKSMRNLLNLPINWKWNTYRALVNVHCDYKVYDGTYLITISIENCVQLINQLIFPVELTHYLKLVEPRFVFCDEEHEETLMAALDGLPDLDTEAVVLQTEPQMQTFAGGFSRDVTSFVWVVVCRIVINIS